MIFTVCDLEKEAASLLEYLQKQIESGKQLVLLTGDLGAGKTALVKHYVQSLGGEAAEVDSPTFSIVNTYQLKGQSIHHFDLYRLASLEEIEDIGFMEYVDSGDTCFVEWPQKIAEFLPEEHVLNVDISLSSLLCRNYSFS